MERRAYGGNRGKGVVFDGGDGCFVFDVPLVSSSENSGSRLGAEVPYVRIGSGVSGIQIGNHNTMSIASCWTAAPTSNFPKYPQQRRKGGCPKTPPPKVVSKIERDNAETKGVVAAIVNAVGGGDGAVAGVVSPSAKAVAVASATTTTTTIAGNGVATVVAPAAGKSSGSGSAGPVVPSAPIDIVPAPRTAPVPAVRMGTKVAVGQVAAASCKKRTAEEIDDERHDAIQDSLTVTELFDDLRIAGVPVGECHSRREREGVVSGNIERPFRLGRESGRDAVIESALNPTRCYCHGVLGRARFCPFVADDTDDDSDLWFDRLERVRKCVVDVKVSGPVPLYNAILRGAKPILENDPTLDLELAEAYVQTARRSGGVSSISATYRCWDRLRPEVQTFFKEHGEAVDAIVQRVLDRVGPAFGRGVYSISVMMDRCGNTVNGREETPVGVFTRVAAALAVECNPVAPGNPGRLLTAKPKDRVQFFDAIFSALASYAIIMSPRVLAFAGLRGKNPLFDSVAYRPQFNSVEATFNGVLSDLCDMLANGVSVSICLSDVGGDCISFLHVLGLHLRELRTVGRFEVTATVYADIWTTDTLKLMRFATGVGRSYQGLRYVFNVPSIFWDRYLDNGGDKLWHLYAKNECASLLKADMRMFRTAYERLETERAGVSVCPWWVVSQLDCCASLGHTSVVYTYNVKNMTLTDGGSVSTCGPELGGFVYRFLGAYAEHNVYVNLENCLLEGMPTDDFDQYVCGNGYRFSLRALCALVRDAVALAEIVLEQTSRSSDVFGVGDMLKAYRPIKVCVLGLHSTLSRLGFRYSSVESFNFNRRVAEVVYFSAARASVDLCMMGADAFLRYAQTVYTTGRFRNDLYGVEESDSNVLPAGSWKKLREDVARYGIRHSTLVGDAFGEEAANFAGTSPGWWPRSANVSHEPSPLFASPRREFLDMEAIMSLAEPRANDPTYLSRALHSEHVFLPVVNRLLCTLPKPRAVAAVRAGRSLINPALTCIDSDDEDDDYAAIVETAWNVPTDSLVKMCLDRQPYVDGGQSAPLCLNPGGSSIELARHLRRANALGLPVGVYKCNVPSSWKYR